MYNFDAGDYNLFRYCHNDPEDLTDPMGLASDTNNFAGLEPREESRRLADDSYNNIMPAAQMNSSAGAIHVAALAGMITAQLQQQALGGVAVTGQVIGRANPMSAPKGNPSDPNAPSKLEILPDKTQDRGPNKLYHLQVETEKGKPLKGSGYTIENVSNKGKTGNFSIGDFTTTNGVPIAFRRGGEVVDRVGLLKAPSAAAYGDIVNRQTYEVIYGGFRYPISTVFEQRIHVENGFVSPALIPIGP